VGTAIARGCGAAVSDAARVSFYLRRRRFRGLGVSSFRADFDSALLFALSDVFFAPDFFFAVFGFGVGVWRRFVFGGGEFLWFSEWTRRASAASSD